MLQAGPGCELAPPPLCPVQPRSGQGRPVGPGLCACEEMSPSGAEAQRVMFRPEPWWPSERSLLRVSRVPLLPAAPSPGQPGARSPLTMPKASWRAILHPQDTGEEGFLEPRAPCVSVCAHAGVCHRTLAHAPPLGTSPRPPSVHRAPGVRVRHGPQLSTRRGKVQGGSQKAPVPRCLQEIGSRTPLSDASASLDAQGSHKMYSV